MDILRDCKKANAEGRPYVVVFVGVNGVGKSTSLSKVCFWLKSQKLKVMLAACDTFRSAWCFWLKSQKLKVMLAACDTFRSGWQTRLESFESFYGRLSPSTAV
ncbi:hypothetical protein T484DRAFT_1815476 [Baffinella frigidus]|nr:hypothetical protein T484DRAFT_1815476 [Cryptophyta sp. CCMP2293]